MSLSFRIDGAWSSETVPSSSQQHDAGAAARAGEAMASKSGAVWCLITRPMGSVSISIRTGKTLMTSAPRWTAGGGKM